MSRGGAQTPGPGKVLGRPRAGENKKRTVQPAVTDADRETLPGVLLRAGYPGRSLGVQIGALLEDLAAGRARIERE